MLHKTVYCKKMRGGHEAKTIVPMGPVTTHEGPGERVLTISTYKSGKGLLTLASVSVEVGTCTIMEIFGDYSKRILLTATRATEKAIRVQHEGVLAEHLHTVYAEAVAFYQDKDAKKAPAKPEPDLPQPGSFDVDNAKRARAQFESDMDALHGPDWTYHDLNRDQLADVDRLDNAVAGEFDGAPFDPDATDTIPGGFRSLVAQAA